MNLIESEKNKFAKDWWDMLSPEFSEQYMMNIYGYIINRKASFASIYPDSNRVYKAFEESYKDIKVVVLGQDPYHTPGMAIGRAFAVSKNTLDTKVPPSLRNIFEEVEKDVYNGLYLDRDISLENWSKQGVFLLNTCLTVEESVPLSHANIGWQKFTQVVFQHLTNKQEPLVFMLWGNHARQYKQFIHNKYHLVLEATHPSPYSKAGFLGCKHFSKANDYLIANNTKPIIW